ncbi:MAG: MobF family relaxase [Corynebacterium sp.]|uniref:MobF family relaxase n=1 Tax=Corynebacterium sp. TaxID=1720 RepID=UPI0026DFA34E|nr:MobF family relaxase [Corynebacterium sp.]MDO5670110.1 MobF family relaxase [Corynebacterium sp.]
MTASITKITAGSGYEYLTRQVARMDATSEASPGLAAYYSEKGESPGRWVGTGLTGMGGLAAGDEVTAAQMWNLFAVGYHPLAEQLQHAAAVRPNATPGEVERAGRLGTPFQVQAGDVSSFRIEVARRLEAYNTAHGLPRSAAITASIRARIRTEVAVEMFTERHGRAPQDTRELAGEVARLSRPASAAVAGFDVTFSPVKSVSTLWALADRPLATTIEQAHQKAVADALRAIEETALYTRVGAGGVRQVDVRGLIGAAFTHRDSRAGDPDLHTHVAIANKVQEAETGRWYSIDGRVLLKAVVTISETYNTALERHLSERLGVRFADRPGPDGKRPVREIVGVEPALNERWSSRRQRIEARRAVLAREFQAQHGRPPSPTEAIGLAQQATLETRDAKHSARSEAQQRATWRAEALEVLGSADALAAMVSGAVGRPDAVTFTPDQEWVEATARRVVGIVQGHRSTWQGWHLRAEALRQLRAANVAGSLVETIAHQVVAHALATHCVSLERPLASPDGSVVEPSEPAALRRADGTSQYTVAGSTLFTSSPVLAAEEYLVAAAGRTGGWAVTEAHVGVALAESAANGVTLNDGQAALVTAMATSGARVQAAIAPAGSGKTTAMRALTQAWTDGGGTVIGLAPSAAAAEQLRDQTGAPTDTLAKLCWHLDQGTAHPSLPRIDEGTLVLVDEAGMADTLSLHQVVRHVLDAGGSVRLIGDDQQLAAIGAGGVLRDIEATHGVLRLDELVRFRDPAEGAASLALRAGRPEALGFYLDQQRVHVGDLATMTTDVFTAWSTDRAAGLDSIMLAPTRELVAELNTRARHQRLNGAPAGREVWLSDGLPASAGDTILTRRNNRRLRTSATDFVKNGDRWQVVDARADGSLHVAHTRTGRRVTLPADYVAEHVELGYASTIHTAQGISVDTTHGVLSGGESRQLLYTMMTRGRDANHAYLAVVSDGNEHTTFAPETVSPLTPTDMLEKILGRDDTPVSATTQTRIAADPATQLADATRRYADAIGVASAQIADPDLIRHLTRRIDAVVPGITDCDAWPTLVNRLLLIAADGRDPFAETQHALTSAPLGDARDEASVLVARLETRTRDRGPLPWLPGIPTRLADHPTWGPYLTARGTLVGALADHVRTATLADASQPAWVRSSSWTPPLSLVADVEVFRAATGVEAADLRPTGDPQFQRTIRRYQAGLDRRLREDHSPALAEWGPLLAELSATMTADPYLPQLARQLGYLSSHGTQVRPLLEAASVQPLPDDHPAAALWWRIAGQLDHAQRTGERRTPDQWLPELTERLGVHAEAMQASPWWVTLVDAVDRGLQRGWPLDALISPHRAGDIQTLIEDVTRLADSHDTPADALETEAPPTDLWDDWNPANPIHVATPDEQPATHELDATEPADESEPPLEWECDDLTVEALIRTGLRLDTDPADTIRLLDQADQWKESPASQDRLELINELTTRFYQHKFTRSWARAYLTDRFGVDVHEHPDLRPGLAPAGWTNLVDHLRGHGITDQEMLTAGVATQARTGHLIDRFRDRVMLPILDPDHRVLGFVGRRNPTSSDERAPKYLNTPDTPLFHKGNQLYGATHLLTTDPTRIPVLAEGPMDAHAITLASHGRYVGLAPLGTSLTSLQATQLASLDRTPIIATDADLAGRLAAERDYWMLTPHGLDPRYAILNPGSDPAELLATGQAAALNHALTEAGSLADALINERISNLPTPEAALGAVAVLAAQPPERWEDGVQALGDRLGLPAGFLRGALKDHVRAWNTNARRAADSQLARTHDVKSRLSQSTESYEAPPSRPNTPSRATKRPAPIAGRGGPRSGR